MVTYWKAPCSKRLDGLPGAEWGNFTRYLEVGDDQYAIRQVDSFENGYALRYDRTDYADAYGMLADNRFTPDSRYSWPDAKEIDEEEFEGAWKESAASAAAELQERSRRPARLPKIPPWLDCET